MSGTTASSPFSANTSAAAATTRARLRTASARVRVAGTAMVRRPGSRARAAPLMRPLRLGIRVAMIAAASATPELTRKAAV